MTIAEISHYLEEKKPIPGLTDVQNATAHNTFSAGRVREAQKYVQDILEPRVKRTNL